jgi:hypothetical protein
MCLPTLTQEGLLRRAEEPLCCCSFEAELLLSYRGPSRGPERLGTAVAET